ncbi:MAG: hypothetical protein MUF28_01895 [Ignavibacterium sp.]|nr:hypothetical protein [Ignavibacterium sp.]
MRIKSLNNSLLIRPSAYLPLFMSLLAILMVVIHFAIYGKVYEADEGVLAHIFQLLMVLQIPIVMYFLFKWLQNKPKQTLHILVLQAALWILAIVAVIFLV